MSQAIEESKTLKVIDLTEGSIMRKLLVFSLPIIIGNVMSMLYNIIGSIIVGQYIGSDAIAAMGVSFSIQMMVNTLYAGLGIGASVCVSQYMGARRFEELNLTVNTALAFGFIMSVVLTIAGIFCSRPLLALMDTPDNIFDDSVVFLVIMFAGSIGTLFLNMGTAILRGLGDAKWPLIILSINTFLTVALDLVFVLVFGLGIAGVGWATIISQFISAAIVVIRIALSGCGIHVSFKTLRINGPMARVIAKLAVPTALQGVIISSGMLVIQFFINSFGSDVVSANTIMQRIDGFILLPIMAIGFAMTTFTGQNIGANKPDRVYKGVKQSIIATVAICLGLGIVLWIFGSYGFRVFTSNESVIQNGTLIVKTLAFFYWAMGINQCFTGIMRGAGAVSVPMIVAIISTIIRIPLSYLLGMRTGEFTGLFHAMIVSNIIGAAIVTAYYLSGKWKNKSVVNKYTLAE